MKILVFMSDNRELEENYELSKYNSQTAVINKEYCNKNGYDFIYYIPHLNESKTVYNCLNPITGNSRHASWSKLLSTKKALKLHYDYVVYIDSDCIFKDFDKRLEIYIERNKDKSIIFLNDKPWSTDKPCAGFYICKTCPESMNIINDWWISSEFPDKDKDHPWEQTTLHANYKKLNIGIVDEWMFQEVEGQFLRHIGSAEDREFNNRETYFKNIISSKKIPYLTDKIHVEKFSTPQISVKTFNVLIATVGRPTLQNMLDSLSPQLQPADCLTVVFDGHSAVPSGFNFSRFMCRVTTYCEPVALKHWGHGIRNKYASLIEKKDFVMHADDDNAYVPDAFKVIRNTCIDENTLYVFKMIGSHQKIFPQNHKIKEFNVDTGMGAIPYELNKKGIWLNRFAGDGSFYEQIAQQAKNISFSDFVTFKIRPHLWNLPAPAPARVKQLKFSGGKICLF